MANEITMNSVSGLSLYACRFQQDGDVFVTDGSSDETWGTDGHDADTYDVAMTEEASSGHYKADFDASSNIAAGVYPVAVYIGAAPADGDTVIGQGEMKWSGTAEITLPSLDTLLDSILEDTGTTIPATIATAQDDLDILTGTDGAELSTAAITALWAKAMSDLSAGAPSVTASALTALNYLYEYWRNKVVTNSATGEIEVYKDDGSTKLIEAPIADDGAKFTKGEFRAAN